MTQNTVPQSLLVSVGGSPAAIVKSIELNHPASVIFFVSRGSYASVTQDILPAVLQACGRIPPHETVVTPDEQDVGASTFMLLRDVPAALHKLGLDADWPEVVDFTGGTKPMSAALVWAASRFPCTFSYIGSDTSESRTKGGLGIVIDNKEKCLLRENPWNEIAYYEVGHAARLFNGGQYANAVTALGNVLDRVSDPRRQRLLTLVYSLWRGYAAWDAFDHVIAIREFAATAQALRDLAPREAPLWPGLESFAEHSQECYELLQHIPTKRPEDLSWPKIHDLVANAVRRARLESKYDDATARCYAAIEKCGKHALKLRHGIDNSKCRPEQLPDALHAEYVRRYATDDPSRPLSFGLQATFRLLVVLGDPVGQRFESCRAELDKVLPLRNASILGHGAIPIKPENFERLLSATLTLLDTTEADLTTFPHILGN